MPSEFRRWQRWQYDNHIPVWAQSLALPITDLLLLFAIFDRVGGLPHGELTIGLGAVVAAPDKVLVAVLLAIRARDQHVRGDKLNQPAGYAGDHDLREAIHQEGASCGYSEHAHGAHRERCRQGSYRAVLMEGLSHAAARVSVTITIVRVLGRGAALLLGRPDTSIFPNAGRHCKGRGSAARPRRRLALCAPAASHRVKMSAAGGLPIGACGPCVREPAAL